MATFKTFCVMRVGCPMWVAGRAVEGRGWSTDAAHPYFFARWYQVHLSRINTILPQISELNLGPHGPQEPSRAPDSPERSSSALISPMGPYLGLGLIPLLQMSTAVSVLPMGNAIVLS